jgi:hypothetical protein
MCAWKRIFGAEVGERQYYYETDFGITSRVFNAVPPCSLVLKMAVVVGFSPMCADVHFGITSHVFNAMPSCSLV